VLFDDFDLIQDTTIGTITGGRPQDPNHGTPPAKGNFIIADGPIGSPFNVTVTFTNPVAYVGFAWGTPDSINELDIYNGSTHLGSFLGDFATPNNQPTTYFNIHADSGEAIAQLVLSSTLDSATGCCFETDNYRGFHLDQHLGGFRPIQLDLRDRERLAFLQCDGGAGFHGGFSPGHAGWHELR
jgi:hypothetical protein